MHPTVYAQNCRLMIWHPPDTNLTNCPIWFLKNISEVNFFVTITEVDRPTVIILVKRGEFMNQSTTLIRKRMVEYQVLIRQKIEDKIFERSRLPLLKMRYLVDDYGELENSQRDS